MGNLDYTETIGEISMILAVVLVVRVRALRNNGTDDSPDDAIRDHLVVTLRQPLGQSY